MSEQPNVLRKRIRILQLNLGKSKDAQLELINRGLSNCYDIILAQEPYISPFNHIPSPSNFRPVIPETRMDATKGTVRSVIWVSANLDTNQWDPLGGIGSNDVTAIRLKNDNLCISIFNVYNDCNNDNSLTSLDAYHDKFRLDLTGLDDDHLIWAGDFNRHHPLWDDERESRLFSAKATDDAHRLIDMIGRWDLDFALPKSEGPTLQHKVTKSFSRPDLVLCSNHSLPLFVSCCVVADEKPTHTDHYPIAFELDVHEGIATAKVEPSFNFRATDWERFNRTLEAELDPQHLHAQLANTVDLEASVERLTSAVQHTINADTRRNKPHPNSKRWWNDDLSKMTKNSTSYVE